MKLIKNILFILFFLVFFGEQIQNNYIWIKTPELQGGIATASKPIFNLDNWLSGKYQDSLMTFFEQNMDLHSSLIRLHNQISYSVFGETNLKSFEVGKDQILFGTGNINSYLGTNFVGEKTVISNVTKLAYIQTELKKRNIDLIFLIAPGKESYIPNFIPARYNLSNKTRSNYDAYAEQFEKQKINTIDFVKYFQKLKPTIRHPLFTRCGAHWSGYGATLVADTLFSYMENLRHIDLPDYYCNGGEETFVPKGTDDDIGRAMNLVNDIPSYKMYYPTIVFKNEENKVKPNVLVIGDSYTWTLINFYNYFPKLFNDKSAFWYYNTSVYGIVQGDKKPYYVSGLNLKEEILGRDYVVLIFTEANFEDFASGFIEGTYNLLKKENPN